MIKCTNTNFSDIDLSCEWGVGGYKCNYGVIHTSVSSCIQLKISLKGLLFYKA